jgi:5-carboxymethyl-2-hydroxymuconate isomerase
MPHLIVEYSANFAADVDPPKLAKHLADAAVETGVFPVAGVRVRFHPVEDYRIADGHPDNAFLHLMIRMGHGRDLDTRKRAGEAIFKALCGYFDAAFGRRPMGLSMEMVEIHPDLNFKQNNMRDYIKARGAQAAE